MKYRIIILCAILLIIPPVVFAQTSDPTPTPTSGSGGTGTQSILVAPEWLETGSSALTAEDFDQAILAFNILALLNPTSSQAYFARGIGYLESEETELALRDMDRAIAYAPDNPGFQATLYTTRAGAHIIAEDTEAALIDYAAAIALEGTPQRYAARAELLVSLDRADEALADYTLAIEAESTPELYLGRARLFALLERPEEAVEDLTSAIDASEGASPPLYLYRAALLTASGDAESAVEDYARFVQLNGTDVVRGENPLSAQPQVIEMTEGLVVVFAVSAERGETLTIRAEGRPGAPVDPILVLFDAQGIPLAADDDSGAVTRTDAQITDYAVTVSGNYTVVVSHSLGGSEGSIAVGLVRGE